MALSTVTFIIATYRRVDALRCTLKSLILQNHEDWTALVIGDMCGDETLTMIRSLAEPRIRYYNLPHRFGEQSGPNSVGLHLAGGDFAAFLNHDDLLLSDHLDVGLSEINASGADFYLGRFAKATRLSTSENGETCPIFTDLLPIDGDDLTALVSPDPWCFEPSSFWLIRTPYAKSVGPWLPARDLWRTPLRNWLMRAWRRGGKFHFGEKLTGLRFVTQNTRLGAPIYSHQNPEHEYMLRQMQQSPADVTRADVVRQITEWRTAIRSAETDADTSTASDRLLAALRWRAAKLQRRVLSPLYLAFGIDLISYLDRVRRRQAGKLLDDMSRLRVGEPLPSRPSVEEVLRTPERYRLI